MMWLRRRISHGKKRSFWGSDRKTEQQRVLWAWRRRIWEVHGHAGRDSNMLALWMQRLKGCPYRTPTGLLTTSMLPPTPQIYIYILISIYLFFFFFFF